MKKIIAFCLYIYISLSLFAQENIDKYLNVNPLLEMVGKPYVEYNPHCSRVVDKFLSAKDTLSYAKLIEYYNEVEAIDKTGEWTFNRRKVEYEILAYKSNGGGLIWSDNYTAQDHLENLLKLVDFAKDKNLQICLIRILTQVAFTYQLSIYNYELAFKYFLLAVDESEKVRLEDYPHKVQLYYSLASLYYTFREYDETIFYCQKVLRNYYPNGNVYYMHSNATHLLGMCYRNAYADYDRSDSCFKQLLEMTASFDEPVRTTWEGVAGGDIGQNYYLRGDLDTALEWLIPAIEKITYIDDMPFASSCAVTVANIYMEKNNHKTAKKYIDKAQEFYMNSRLSNKPNTKSSKLYDVQFKYYAYINDGTTAIAYHDSTTNAQKRENDEFSGLVLHRFEQQLHVSDNLANENKLEIEKAKNRLYSQTLIITLSALVIIILLLAMTLTFYRRKRKAYQELVRKNQTWAGVEIVDDILLIENENLEESIAESNITELNKSEEESNNELTKLPSQEDFIIMKEIEDFITTNELYKNSDLTLDILASETKFNKYYISTALNRCAGINFKTYINEFRIKEAIRLLSDSASKNLSITDIAAKSGFSDRKSFHRVFKKITGLSPSEFRQNIDLS